MKVYVEESHDLPLIGLTLSFRAGSTSDPLGKEGLSRITARMLRRGAEGLTGTAIEETIDGLGAEFSADVGGSTSSLSIEGIARNIDPLIDFIAQILATPTFDDAALQKLLREAEGELLEARDNDGSLVSRALRRTLFEGHPFGRRAAGTTASLPTITTQDVRTFYATHYTRNNAVVAVSGDVSEAKAIELAERLVARLPEGQESPYLVPEPTLAPQRTLVFVDKPNRTQTQMVVGGLGSHPRDSDHMALHVANTIFGGTFTARLMREIRSKRGWSYGASSRLPYDRLRDTFTMWTAPGASDAAACLSLKLSLLEKWRAKGVTPKELTFTKAYLARSHVFDIDTAGKRVFSRLATDLYHLPADYHRGYVDNVKAVTKEQADASIVARIHPEALVIAVVGTHAEIGKAIEAAIPGLTDVRVVPYDLE
jgi:zinc protease